MRKRTTHTKTLALIILIIIPAFIIIRFVINLLNGSSWDGNSRYTIAFATKPPLILSLNPQNKKITVLSLPSNYFLPVSENYGKYILENLWRFSLLEKKSGYLFQKSLQSNLGLKIDAFWGLTDKKNIILGDNPDGKKISAYFQNIFSLNNAFVSLFWSNKEIMTNISPLDKWKIAQTIKAVNKDDLKFFTSEDYHFFLKNYLPDKSPVLILEEKSFDLFLKDKFYDSQVSFESPTVVIKNATSIPGLAWKIGRILQNSGFQVISISNIRTKLNKNICLVTDKNKFRFSLAALQKIINCSISTAHNLTADFEITIFEENL